eukprot:IDg10743t1
MDNGVTLLNQPSHNPDINQFENLWACLVRDAYAEFWQFESEKYLVEAIIVTICIAIITENIETLPALAVALNLREVVARASTSCRSLASSSSRLHMAGRTATARSNNHERVLLRPHASLRFAAHRICSPVAAIFMSSLSVRVLKGKIFGKGGDARSLCAMRSE